MRQIEEKVWSYTMDYETDEIVINVSIDTETKVRIRATEKDIDSMKSWFDLAKHMKND